MVTQRELKENIVNYQRVKPLVHLDLELNLFSLPTHQPFHRCKDRLTVPYGVMSTNPTDRISERRRFIESRAAALQQELDSLAAERAELDVAERVLKRFSEPPTMGGNTAKTPVSTPAAHIPGSAADDEHLEGPTLPQMVFMILNEAKAEGRKGADGAEIVRIVRERWKPNFTSENIRPTLWRMAKKEGRLRKRGKIYMLPISSPEGETEAVGASARH